MSPNPDPDFVHFPRVAIAQRPQLLTLMRTFYRTQHLPFSSSTRRAVDTLLAQPSLGRIHFIQEKSKIAGYLVLTFSFSLERCGRTALLDELFILPAHRNHGLGTAAVHFAASAARQSHCRALHLEVDHSNPQAHTLYTRLGFTTQNRHFLTLPLLAQ